LNTDIEKINTRLKAIEILIIESSSLLQNDERTSYKKQILRLRELKVSTPIQMDIFNNEFKEILPSFSEKIEANLAPILSKSELNLVKFILIHDSNSEISSQLGIGIESLRTRIYRIRKKLKIKNQADFIETIKNINKNYHVIEK
jgi:DNA-binding CsgD family transcriptional regulator